jgi:hypothetical protein
VVETSDAYLVTYLIARPVGTERVGDLLAISADVSRTGQVVCGDVVKAPTRLPDDVADRVKPVH